MLGLIFFFSTLIWLSSSQRYLFPSDDKANADMANQVCTIKFTNGRLYGYSPIRTTRRIVQRLFREYRFQPCPAGENCEEHYVGGRLQSECRVLRRNQPVYDGFTDRYTDCTTPRRYICEGNRVNCLQPAIQHLCQDSCRSKGSLSYECTCNNGYTLNTRCIDNDECSTGTHQCHALADCTNSIGSYQCICKAGSTGDGKNCQVAATTTNETTTIAAASSGSTSFFVITAMSGLLVTTLFAVVIYKRLKRKKNNNYGDYGGSTYNANSSYGDYGGSTYKTNSSYDDNVESSYKSNASDGGNDESTNTAESSYNTNSRSQS